MVLLALESRLLLLGLLLVLLQHWYAEAEKERNQYMCMFPLSSVSLFSFFCELGRMYLLKGLAWKNVFINGKQISCNSNLIVNS